MRLQTARKCAFALCLFAAAEARADPITWRYSTFISGGGQISADNPNTGSFSLESVGGGGAGSSYITLSNLNFASLPQSVATFTDAKYTLNLDLTDTQTGITGQMSFTGHLDGTIGLGSWLLNNTFTGQTTQSQILGSHLFTVTLIPFAPPSEGAFSGRITALLSVQDAPEPSTLVLSGLALSLFGAGWWRRRRAARAAAPVAV